MKLLQYAHTYRWLLLTAVVALVFPFGVAQAGVISGFVYDIVSTVFGWLVFLGAMVLNYGINEFIIKFGTNFTGTSLGGVVDTTWSTIRDLFNLTFIFGLVYIGFKMILRTDDGQTRRWLVNLILAALLVNFSLFITKFVVDFSNILAVEIMNIDRNFFPPKCDDGSFYDASSPCATAGGGNEIDLSGAMQNAMRVISVTSDNGSAGIVGRTESGSEGWALVFGTMFLYIVTAFVYFSAGILLIVRGVVLLILMIVSPFLFLGMVLPVFRTFSSGLWSTLFKRAFLAPIYIALLYISMSLAQTFAIGGNFSQALVPEDGVNVVNNTTQAFGPFIIIVVLLLASLSAAKKLGAEGAGMLISAGDRVRRRAQNQVKRGGRWAASQTAGRGARAASNAAGRGLNRGLQSLQQVQGSGAIASATKRIARSNAVQGGVSSTATNLQNARFGLKRTIDEEKQMRNATDLAADKGVEQAKNLAILSDASSSTKQLDDAMGELAKTIGKMNATELSNQGADKLKDTNIALNLSDSQIEGLEKTNKFTGTEIQDIKDARKNAQLSVATSGFTSNEAAAKSRLSDDDKAEFTKLQQARLAQKSVRDMGNMSADVFAASGMTNYIKPPALNERLKSGVSAKELDAIQKNIQNSINSSAQQAKVWKQWAEKSEYSAQMNLKFADNTPSETTGQQTAPSGPQIIQPGDSQATQDAKTKATEDYRQGTSQDDILGK